MCAVRKLRSCLRKTDGYGCGFLCAALVVTGLHTFPTERNANAQKHGTSIPFTQPSRVLMYVKPQIEHTHRHLCVATRHTLTHKESGRLSIRSTEFGGRCKC